MTAWIIGGGSGIGRGAAVALAGAGEAVVVSGRRAAELDAVVAEIRASGGEAHAAPLDVADPDAVQTAAERIAADHGPVRTLVYSAGTNVRDRFWSDTAPADFARIVDINLNGAMRAIHAVLPAMRDGGGGLVVLVSSWAGWRFAPGAGAAYSTSKTALGALAETVNAQERLNGIRATHFCPGEVATDILDTRPVPPSATERELMLTSDDVGSAIRWIAELPARICVNEIVFTPTANTSYS